MLSSLKIGVFEFQRRHNLIPFEGGFALFMIYSGFINLFDFGVIPSIFSKVYGEVFTMFSNIVYLIAGFGIYFGIGFARRDFEAFGLILIISSLFTRIVLLTYALGINAQIFNNYVFNLVFIIMCIVRLNTLFRRHIIIKLDDMPAFEQLANGKHNISVEY